MANNVEVLLEIVDGGKCLLLMGRSDIHRQLQCIDMFIKVVDMVIDVKSQCYGEPMHKIKVLDPAALKSQSIPSANELLWCDATSVIRAIRIGKRAIQSTCKTKQFPVEKMDWLHRFTLHGKCSIPSCACRFIIVHTFLLADKIFPINYKLVSAFLEGVTERWQEIARELGLSELTIHRIHETHQGNTELCCQQMIEECLVGTETKMKWHTLTMALRRLEMDLLAGIIDENWGKQIQALLTFHSLNPCCISFR